VSNSIPEGYFKDSNGQLQKERRQKIQRDRRNEDNDRRSFNREAGDGDRRNRGRRNSDEATLEKEHKHEIEEALEDFAEDHED